MNIHTHERKIPLRLLAGSGLLFSLMMPGYSQGMPGAPAKPSTVLVQKASTIDSAVNKKYIGQVESIDRVTVQPRADESQILKMSSGVVLDDGTKTMPCAINVVTDEPGRTVMEMTLKEGKNREIRRMCESVGLEVVRLKRNAEGVVKLGMLKPGTYRELTKAEVNGLRAAAVKGRAQTRSAVQQSKAAERRPRGPVGKNAPRKQK